MHLCTQDKKGTDVTGVFMRNVAPPPPRPAPELGAGSGAHSGSMVSGKRQADSGDNGSLTTMQDFKVSSRLTRWDGAGWVAGLLQTGAVAPRLRASYHLSMPYDWFGGPALGPASSDT